MKLEKANKNIAREQAKAYLDRSIRTLEYILGVDAFSLELTGIPVEKDSELYDAYHCLLTEVEAYHRIVMDEKI
jgi:hypothetical protein